MPKSKYKGKGRGKGNTTVSAPVPGMDKFKWTKETDISFDLAMVRVHELRK